MKTSKVSFDLIFKLLFIFFETFENVLLRTHTIESADEIKIHENILRPRIDPDN